MAQKFAEENLPEGVSEQQLTQMARQLLTKAEDGKKDLAVDTLIKVNQTGKTGDGKIFVLNTLDSFSVHSGQSGNATLD